MSELASSAATVTIYRGLDRPALDAAYNNSAAVADSAAWTAGWIERSEPLRASSLARLDVPYGPAARTRLDYLPAGTKGAPLFVFVHGGYWQRNDKDSFAFVAAGPHAHGVDVAVLGYSLAPAARLSQIVAEIDSALSYLHRRADDFGFSPQHIYVGGWSAGGHLTALASAHPAVRGGLAISGIFDLEPIAMSFINDLLRLDRAETQNLSPLRQLRGSMAPLRLCVGGNELDELQRQSRDYAAAASGLGLPVKFRTLPGHHHFSILDELAKPDGVLTGELLSLMSKA